MPILSTGTINKTRSTRFAHIEILNLLSSGRLLLVQVIDWDRRALIFNSLTIASVGNTNLSVDVSNVPFHYEIRVTVPTTRNLIVNTFAVDSGTFTVENNNVLQHQLIEVFQPLPILPTRILKAKVIFGKKLIRKPQKSKRVPPPFILGPKLKRRSTSRK
jgi:hypothetical protein